MVGLANNGGRYNSLARTHRFTASVRPVTRTTRNAIPPVRIHRNSLRQRIPIKPKDCGPVGTPPGGTKSP